MINRLSYIFLTPLLGLSAALLFVLSSRDVQNYRNLYDASFDFSIGNLVWVEPGWLFLFFAFRNIDFPFELLTTLIILFVFCFKSHFMYRHSTGYLYSLLFYSVWFLPLHDATQLRISVTIVFLFYSCYSLSLGRHTTSVFMIFLALLFHYSAISFILFHLSHYFQTRLLKLSLQMYLSLLFITSLTVGLAGGGLINIINQLVDTSILSKLQLYIARGDTNSIFTPKSLFAVVSSLFFISNVKLLKLNDFEKLCLHLYILGTCSYFLFIDVSILSTRVSEIFFTFLIFLLPKFVRAFKEVSVAQLILILFAFIIGYYYFFYVGLFHEH